MPAQKHGMYAVSTETAVLGYLAAAKLEIERIMTLVHNRQYDDGADYIYSVKSYLNMAQDAWEKL